jgi:hypothetical protein
MRSVAIAALLWLVVIGAIAAAGQLRLWWIRRSIRRMR